LKAQDDAEYHFMFGEKQRLFGETGRGSIFAELEFNMGAAYTQAVMWCLEAGPDVTHGVDDEDFADLTSKKTSSNFPPALRSSAKGLASGIASL